MDKIKEIIEITMKKSFDKGIEIGLANSGKMGRVTVSVTDIRDSAYQEIMKAIEECIPERKTNDKSPNDFGFNQAIAEVRKAIEEGK